MPDSTDALLSALAAAAQSGSQPAYRDLLRACAPIAAAAARRHGVPPARIDDVVQDVLLTIHRARATYDPARPFLPWLHAIAQRRAIDALRRHGRVQRFEQAVERPGEDLPAPESEPDLDQDARARRLLAAIRALPEGQRQAVELLALGEQSLAEAAAKTGRSTGALKVNLHRAIGALRKRLADSDV